MSENTLRWKVCGLREPANIEQVSRLQPDWAGFIFYPPSPRFAGATPPEALAVLPPSVGRVGVFVNETPENILHTAEKFGLGWIQLHGDETPELCSRLRAENLRLIKVFRIADRLPGPDVLDAYRPFAELFLFDTQTSAYGGSGKTFPWELLAGYNYPHPYLLSGGIGLHNLGQLQQISLPGCMGIDVNSAFETAPGLKDIGKLESLKEWLVVSAKRKSTIQ